MNTLLQKATSKQVEAISLLTGEDALVLLGEEGFQLQWDMLHTSCPWSTVFQSRAFVYTWYQTYKSVYLPVIAVSFQEEKLIGLLTLAQDDSGQLVGAGANQAEYQVWLTSEHQGNGFIKQALTRLLEKFPQSEISLKFAPANTPLQWIDEDPTWKKHCFLRTAKQPLICLDKENLSQELRKKNRKEKLNRLRRQGNLSFVKLTDVHEFSAVLDELALQSDFRKGAMYNKCTFQEDPYRKLFLRKLFDEGLLHATLLKLDNVIIASNVSVAGQQWVHLQGINTHSPMQAKHSPGILHFLMLGVMLAEEGIAVFDLTPGSDAYKESLATDYTHATELVFGNKADILNRKVKYNLSEYSKRTLPKLGITHQQIRQLTHKAAVLKEKAKLVKKRKLYPLIRQSVKRIGSADRIQIFRVQTIKGQAQTVVVKRNELRDLLCYTPESTLISKWEFLMDAMRRLETGQHVYTWQEQGKLLGYTWLSEAKLSKLPCISNLAFPEQAVILHDITCPSLNQAQTGAFLQAVATIVPDSQDQPVYAIADAGNKSVYKALASLYPTYTPQINEK